MIVRFLSLAALSQIVLVAHQLILLPLQIHAWGHETVALWLSVLATSAILGAADLGLRNDAFALLSRNDSGPQFNSVWTICRLHLLVVAGIVGIGIVTQLGGKPGSLGIWFLIALVFSSFLDVIFLMRTAILEACGLISRCEILFVLLAGSRLVLGALGILALDASPGDLAILWVVTGVIVVVLQSQMKEAIKFVPLWGRWTLKDSAATYKRALWLGAAPLSAWAQIQFPVIALAAVAPAPMVSAFVAVRSVFSLARAVIMQVSRIASVQYIAQVRTGDEGKANATLILLAGATAWGVTGACFAAFAEHQMILGPLFNLPDGEAANIYALFLGLAAVCSVHQLFAVTLVRSRHFRRGGQAGYVNILAMAVVGVITLVTSQAYLLPAGLLLCDALFLAQVLPPFLKVGFASDSSALGLRVAFLAAMGAFIAAAVGAWAFFEFYFYRDMAGVHKFDLGVMAAAMACASAIALAAGGAGLAIFHGQFNALFGKRLAT